MNLQRIATDGWIMQKKPHKDITEQNNEDNPEFEDGIQ